MTIPRKPRISVGRLCAVLADVERLRHQEAALRLALHEHRPPAALAGEELFCDAARQLVATGNTPRGRQVRVSFDFATIVFAEDVRVRAALHHLHSLHRPALAA